MEAKELGNVYVSRLFPPTAQDPSIDANKAFVSDRREWCYYCKMWINGLEQVIDHDNGKMHKRNCKKVTKSDGKPHLH